MVFEKMANTFLDIQNAECFFPDAKISNWLVDKRYNLFIGDTKSFLFANKNGFYSPDVTGNEYYPALLSTPDFRPPEFLDEDTINVDNAHDMF